MASSTMEAGFPLGGRLFRECAAEYGVLLETRAPHSVLQTPAEMPWRPQASSTPRLWPNRSSSPSAISIGPGNRISTRWRTRPYGTLPGESLFDLQQRYQALIAAEMRASPARLLQSSMLYAFARRP